MGVLLRYLLHDMVAQYRRTLLVLVTLALSSASMFAALSLSGTMVALGTAQWRAEYGWSDVTVTATPASPSRYFNVCRADAHANAFEYAVYRLSSGGALVLPNSEVPVQAKGYNLAELMKMVPMHFEAQDGLFPFEGNRAVVSRKTAADYGIAVGDVLTVRINGNSHALRVCAVAYAEGPFAFEQDRPAVLLPWSKMQAFLGELGRADAAYLGLRDPASKSRVIRALAGVYGGYRVAESYSEDHVRLQANRTAVPFVFMSALLCFMAVYVLSTLFTGIVEERLPLMGLFRVLGAAGRDTWLVLLTESLLYGVAGGLIACAAGPALLWAVTRALVTGADAQFISLAVGPPQLVLTVACAAATSLAGALACLLSRRDDSISLQLRGLRAQAERGGRTAWLGAAVLLASGAVPLLWRSEQGLVPYILCVLAQLGGLALLSPALYARAAGLVGSAMGRATGKLRLAVLNSRGRRDFATSATILSIIVSTLVVVSSIAYSDGEGMRRYYGRFRYDIELTAGGLNGRTVNLVRQMNGVEAACGTYLSGSVDVAGQSIPLYRVQGISEELAAEFVDYSFSSSLPSPAAALMRGRNLLLTRTMQGIYGVAEGDELVLKIFGRDGRYREAAYTVIGFYDDHHTKLGRVALIAEESFREDFAAGDYDCLYIRSRGFARNGAAGAAGGEAEAAADALEDAFNGGQAAVSLLADVRREVEGESARIIGAMGIISMLAVATGILGVMNNALLSFLRRRRELGLYYAMGMTARDILGTVTAELMLGGLLGSLCGLAMGSFIALAALPRLVFALQIALRIYPDALAFGAGLPSGLLAAALASALCLPFLSRRNPMDGLRRED